MEGLLQEHDEERGKREKDRHGKIVRKAFSNYADVSVFAKDGDDDDNELELMHMGRHN